MGHLFMVRGRLKKSRALRGAKKFLTFAPFTVFLIGIAVLLRFWTVAPLVMFNDCEYKYFWLSNWSGGYSVLQLILMAVFLMVGVALLNLVFSRTKTWIESCIQVAMALLLMAGGILQYTELFPYSSLAGETSEIQTRIVESPNMVLRGKDDLGISVIIHYPPGVEETLAQYRKEIEFAPWPEDGYYLIVREDLSIEKVQAVGSSGSRFLIRGNYPDHGEIQGLRACIARKQEFISKLGLLSNDRNIIWIEEVGYLGTPKMRYNWNSKGYYDIYPIRLIKKPMQISLHR